MKRIWLALGLAACTQRTDLLPIDGGTTDAAPACSGLGAPIVLGTDAPCSGALAARLLRYALCVCTPLTLPYGLSTQLGGGGGDPQLRTAAVGVDASVQVAGAVQIGGPLSAMGATFGESSQMLGTLYSDGPVLSNKLFSIGNDVYASGNVEGHIDIGGTLYVPSNVDVGPMVSFDTIERGPVALAPACGCAAGAALDIPGAIAARRSTNDDGSIGLASDAFAGSAPPSSLSLPCGEYFLSSLTASSSELEVAVHGRAALFIDGDLIVPGGLRVTFDSDAELDLVVAGDVHVGSGTLGAMLTPAMRLWVAGTRIELGAGAALSASTYAPNALVEGDSDIEIFGALYARGLSASGDVSIRYDPKLLDAGVTCDAPPQLPVY